MDPCNRSQLVEAVIAPDLISVLKTLGNISLAFISYIWNYFVDKSTWRCIELHPSKFKKMTLSWKVNRIL